MDDVNLTTESGIEDNPVAFLDPSDTQEIKNLESLCDTKVIKSDDTKPVTESIYPVGLNDVIVNALEKVKNFFLNSEIEEQKLAEFMLKILTLNAKDMDHNDFKSNPGILDKIVDQITDNRESKNDSDGFTEFLESFFGKDTAKTINEKLSTDNIDEIVEKLLGKDTKKMICDRLENDNLDDLLNKLVDEKLAIDGDPQAKHPNFDDFIGKILGDETKEFIRKKLEVLSNENKKD